MSTNSNSNKPNDTVIHIAESPSIVCQTLLIMALADGKSKVRNFPINQETLCLIDALRCLGLFIRVDEAGGQLEILGCGGLWPNSTGELYCSGNFDIFCLLTAACSIGRGHYQIDGDEQLHQTNIQPLINALINLGATVTYEDRKGYPPITTFRSSLRGGTVGFASRPSLSILYSLLIVAPYASSDVFIELRGDPIDREIIQTRKLMETFGVSVVNDNMKAFIIPSLQRYKAGTCHVD